MSTNGDDKPKRNPNAPKESKKTTREKAQAAREAAEAEQRRRDRRIRIIGAVVLIAIVGGIIAAAVVFRPKPADPGSIVADAKIPTGALPSDNTNAFGVPYKTSANKPVLAIWEDFQCPICGNFEKTMGATVTKLADDGKVTVIHRPTTFLDQAHPESNSASARATAAWGCAIDAGKGEAYHNQLFANQPTVEGTGWTDQQLMDFGTAVGITGDAAATFQKCYTDKTYTQWTTNSYLTFINDGVAGTPTAYLNGKEVPSATLTDPAALTALIASTTG
jgi:protein-disulfide isomerase